MAPRYGKAASTKEVPTGAAAVLEETEQEANEVEPTPESDEVVETEVADELVQVRKSDLEEFLNRLNTLEADNKKLLQVADRGRMAAIEEGERAKNQSLPQVKLSMINSRLIVAWRMTENESYVDNGRLIEKQTMEVFYEDGSSEVMPLVMFYRQQNKDTIAHIIARTQSVEGEGETLKVRLLDGRTLEIDLKFVN